MHRNAAVKRNRKSVRAHVHLVRDSRRNPRHAISLGQRRKLHRLAHSGGGGHGGIDDGLGDPAREEAGHAINLMRHLRVQIKPRVFVFRE
jgi:hypothetical protein